MADGIRDTVNFFTGSVCEIRTLSAYMENNEISDDEIAGILAMDPEDEMVIFTDISSGSVTQKLYPHIKSENIFMISGVNLPIILSLVLADQEKLTHEIIDQLIIEAKDQLMQIKIKEDNGSDDE